MQQDQQIIMGMLCIFQKGFNYSQDGPGNRLVYHLQGCNLSCPWCSNPEGMPFDGGETETVEHLLEEADRCRPLFFDGGGVTFTGGECTCRFDALKAALIGLRERQINTAIETNGTHPRLPELFPLLDTLIMDCKHYCDAIHQQVVGLGNQQILKNLRLAMASHPHLIIRIPLIGGFNASEKDMDEFAAILKPYASNGTAVELLRYHEYGKDKWAKCGMKYTVENAFVSEEERKRYEDILSGHGLHIVRT